MKNIDDMIKSNVIYCVSMLILELKDKYYIELEDVLGTVNEDPENPDEEIFTEALEHWLVSLWLGRRLEEKGEMVIYDFFGLSAIWGRTTSGQAISQDSVIEEIYKENY